MYTFSNVFVISFTSLCFRNIYSLFKSNQMESILVCPRCELKFDTNEKTPRLLPCSRLICYKCIDNYKQILGGYIIECECSSKIHNIDKLDDLYPSQLTLHYLNREKTELQPSSQNMFVEIKDLLDQYKYKLEVTKYDIDKHYDDMEMDIDIRAETLINFIHESRDSLHSEIKNHREETNLNTELFQEKFNNDLKKLETKFNLQKTEDSTEVKKFVQEFNKSQNSIDDLKRKAWYFVENSSILDKSLLGYNLSVEFDKNYLKIKNINSLLLNDFKRFQISLKPSFKDEKLRQYIVPITRRKILICYFTISKCIHLELFDQNGESIKIQKVAEHVTYFPIILSSNDMIILSYISKVKLRNHDLFGESTISFISLFDSNLNLLKTITDKSLIESIYINDSKIICSFAHKTFDCCKVYDLDLNFIESFGQQNDKEKPFFMEKTNSTVKQNYNSKEKLNPSIFGFSSNKIYFFNSKKMFIMSRKLGIILNSIDKINEKSYFILDSQSNVIELNTHSNKIKLFNFENEILVESSYDLNFDDAFLIEDKYFVFVNKQKETLMIV